MTDANRLTMPPPSPGVTACSRLAFRIEVCACQFPGSARNYPHRCRCCRLDAYAIRECGVVDEIRKRFPQQGELLATVLDPDGKPGCRELCCRQGG